MFVVKTVTSKSGLNQYILVDKARNQQYTIRYSDKTAAERMARDLNQDLNKYSQF